MCREALGTSWESACSRGTGIGAPAESTVVTFARAERCGSVSSFAVATTFTSAAGEANTVEASMASAAEANAVAVKVFGLVTSILGVTLVAPRAGPRRANGAKPATRADPSSKPYV